MRQLHAQRTRATRFSLARQRLPPQHFGFGKLAAAEMHLGKRGQFAVLVEGEVGSQPARRLEHTRIVAAVGRSYTQTDR